MRKNTYSLIKNCWILIILCKLIIGVGCDNTPPDDSTMYDRYWVQYQHEIDNVNGIKSDILNYYGRLGGQISDIESHQDTTYESFSWVYCGIGKYQDDTDMWAQAGIGKFRLEGNIYIHKGLRCEVRGFNSDDTEFWEVQSKLQNPDYNPPQDGDTSSFICELDEFGAWHIDMNEFTFYFDQVHSWLTPGMIVLWEGEITHFENDIPGFFTNPVVMHNLKYKTLGDIEYTGAKYYSADLLRSTYPDEWYIGIDTTLNKDVERVNIWDKKPN
ncbi:MAG: hypothetical protein V3V99_04605 [candidate division Zixibacteria bacterium]